ncbi:MAG: hypothetical protein M3Z04_08245, partial [Chloroflexota bacterium]|nr:hypothetical protein [Chloroflexota bacterium]
YWTLRVDGQDAGLSVSDMIMAPNAVLPRLAAGSHQLRVELRDSLGAALNPPVFKEQAVTLANAMIFDSGSSGPPTIKLILPAAGASIPPEHPFLKARFINFRPDARRIGQANAPGTGTWWVEVDGQFAGLSMSEIHDLPNDALLGLSVGTHRITASLHNNDGSAIPGASDTITVTVTAPLGTPPPGSLPTAKGCGQEGGQFFPETGHTVCGSFLLWWNRYGGLAQFGYPITEPLAETDPATGRSAVVQYFQRARFELHPENAGTPYEVLLGRLGVQFHAPDPTVPAQRATGNTYFAATGHNLSGAFRDYWQAHGGLFVNGYPISEELRERAGDGQTYTVQYFERARYELHPEHAGTPSAVLLGLLGVQSALAAGLIPITP